MAKLTDAHVHLAAFPEPQGDCFISDKINNSLLFKYFFRKLELDPRKPEESNKRYVEKLVAAIRSSQHVQKAVVLAMDGAYDAQGLLNKEATEFLISNNYILKTVAQHPNELLAGVSINPQRRDAIEELDRCAAAGTVLVKVLPNAQVFDPANPAYLPFWKRMAHHQIKLLSHIGYEFSLIGQDQSVGDLIRLKNALDAGVTVIAAHGASTGLFFYEKHWDTFRTFVKRYPNFYWDCSALTLMNRFGMLLKIRRCPELWPRMVFGTDYPLPVLPIPLLAAGKWRAFQRVRKIENPFDRQVELLAALGIPISENLAL